MFGRWRGVLQCGPVLPGSRASLGSSSSPSVSIRGAPLETLEIRFKFEQALNFARKCPSPKHFLKLFFSGTSDAQFSPLLLRRGHVFVSSSLSLCSVAAKFRIS